MSVNYSAKLMYGYKLNGEEATKIWNYLRDSDNEEYLDEYFHNLGLDFSDGAIFGIEISNACEGDAVFVKSICPNNPKATNMTWAWEFNTSCNKMLPHISKSTYLCCFVD